MGIMCAVLRLSWADVSEHLVCDLYAFHHDEYARFCHMFVTTVLQSLETHFQECKEFILPISCIYAVLWFWQGMRSALIDLWLLGEADAIVVTVRLLCHLVASNFLTAELSRLGGVCLCISAGFHHQRLRLKHSIVTDLMHFAMPQSHEHHHSHFRRHQPSDVHTILNSHQTQVLQPPNVVLQGCLTMATLSKWIKNTLDFASRQTNAFFKPFFALMNCHDARASHATTYASHATTYASHATTYTSKGATRAMPCLQLLRLKCGIRQTPFCCAVRINIWLRGTCKAVFATLCCHLGKEKGQSRMGRERMGAATVRARAVVRALLPHVAHADLAGVQNIYMCSALI